MQRVILIYATGLGGQFCHANKLPWKCKDDLNFLYKKIKNQNLIVTPTTLATMPKGFAVKIRSNILTAKDIENPITLQEEIDFYKNPVNTNYENVWIIGGRSLFKEALEKKLFTDIVHCVINYSGPGEIFSHYKREHFEALGCRMADGLKMQNPSLVGTPKMEPFLNCQALDRFHYTTEEVGSFKIALT